LTLLIYIRYKQDVEAEVEARSGSGGSGWIFVETEAEAFFIKYGASASSNLAAIFEIKYNKKDSLITICVQSLFIVVRNCAVHGARAFH